MKPWSAYKAENPGKTDDEIVSMLKKKLQDANNDWQQAKLALEEDRSPSLRFQKAVMEAVAEYPMPCSFLGMSARLHEVGSTYMLKFHCAGLGRDIVVKAFSLDVEKNIDNMRDFALARAQEAWTEIAQTGGSQ